MEIKTIDDLNYLNILNFWFVKLSNSKDWFLSGNKYDEIIKEKFKDYLDFYDEYGLESWESKPKSCLALIILLDQFPRHIYRDTQDAFKYELEVARISDDNYNKYKNELNAYERLFFLLPLRHAESILYQEISINIWKDMIEKEMVFFEKKEQELLKKGLGKAIKDHDIIIKFGRFPHRNKVYKRQHTHEERIFLVTKRL